MQIWACGSTETNVPRYDYDALNRVTLVRDALGAGTNYVYQSGCQQVKVRDAGDFVTSTSTDPVLRSKVVTRPEGVVLTTDFDSAGNVIKETDALGLGPAYESDAANRRTAR